MRALLGAGIVATLALVGFGIIFFAYLLAPITLPLGLVLVYVIYRAWSELRRRRAGGNRL